MTKQIQPIKTVLQCRIHASHAATCARAYVLYLVQIRNLAALKYVDCLLMREDCSDNQAVQPRGYGPVLSRIHSTSIPGTRSRHEHRKQ